MQLIKQLQRSIWLFPALLLLPIILFTALGISGSSIGVYHDIFYGEAVDDPDLLFGEPRTIRSDEWLVNTQATIAQHNNDYDVTNNNVGNGQDNSFLIDAPSEDWTTIFKPHNWGFFVLPFDNAFALRWWIPGYLLALSFYFLSLYLIPKKRLIASLLATSLFFTPFIQWWYLYGTMAPIAFGILSLLAGLKLLEAQKRPYLTYAWLLFLVYSTAAFILVLYPPFQIPIGLAILALGGGLLIEKIRLKKIRNLSRKLAVVFIGILIAGILSVSFLVSRSSIIETVQNTAYPGQRSVESGKYSKSHLLSNHLSTQLQFTENANSYGTKPKERGNQSTASNFILLITPLFLPGLYLLYEDKKRKRATNWPLLFTSGLFLVFLARLFVPLFDPLYKLVLLDQVPLKRLVIGVGIVSFFHTLLFIRTISKRKKPIDRRSAAAYSLAVYAGYVLLGLLVQSRFPGYVDQKTVILLSLPLPLATYALLQKQIVLALLVFATFNIFSSARVNPLYFGTDVLRNSELSQAIQEIGAQSDRYWITESIETENFASFNGEPSLSGVYSYPQFELWRSIDDGLDEETYNRYAHVNFGFDRDDEIFTETGLVLTGKDSFNVVTETCSDFLQQNNVGYIIAIAPFDGPSECVELAKTVTFPAKTYYIYQLIFD